MSGIFIVASVRGEWADKCSAAGVCERDRKRGQKRGKRATGLLLCARGEQGTVAGGGEGVLQGGGFQESTERCSGRARRMKNCKRWIKRNSGTKKKKKCKSSMKRRNQASLHATLPHAKGLHGRGRFRTAACLVQKKEWVQYSGKTGNAILERYLKKKGGKHTKM